MTLEPEDYGRFLRSLHLERVRLVSVEAVANVERPEAQRNVVSIIGEETYEVQEWGFEAFQKSRVIVSEADTERESGFVQIVFGFSYRTQETKDKDELDKYFAIFSESTLRFNAYPFLREFVHSLTARMDWPLLTLPLLQLDSDDEEEAEGSDEEFIQ